MWHVTNIGVADQGISDARSSDRLEGQEKAVLTNDRQFPSGHFGMVGRSPAIMKVFEQIWKIAPRFTNVLVVGPTGSGKELVARALHKLSPVGAHTFAVCNSSALVDTLLETQLFGHVRGAFTGATETRRGLFEYANGGTVFLDEIGEMPFPMQAALLRAIENHEIQRVGSPEVRKVDIRLIAATNRNLRAEAMAGRFREDLYYRLSTLEICVPSLAERIEDIPLLVDFFVGKFNRVYDRSLRGVTPRAMDLLRVYPWPGSVRELENAISGACIVAESALIDVADLPSHIQGLCPGTLGSAEGGNPVVLGDVKRRHIAQVLELCEGNVARAAEMLGIGRTSLYRYLKRLEGIETEGAGTETEPGSTLSLGRSDESGAASPRACDPLPRTGVSGAGR